MRFLFHGPGPTEFRTKTPIAYSTGIPPIASSVLSEVQRSFRLTGNKGNIIHAEAAPKLFRKNEIGSCIAGLTHLHQYYGAEYAKTISAHFDVVVISMANFIRPKQDHTLLVSAIKALPESVKVIVIGAGIQDNVKLDKLTDSTKELARIFNDRSTVFGVRGFETKEWLESQGLHNAIVLGCPSLYVYPISIMGMTYNNIPKEPRIITAGHLSRHKLTGIDLTKRGLHLADAFENVKADYLFQDEPFGFEPHMGDLGLYNESTGELRSEVINNYLSEISGKKISFGKYYYFHDSSAWRQIYRLYDVYIGDRFHGGVVALQMGLPSIFLQDDKRVRELTNYHKLPTMPLLQFKEVGPQKAIAEILTDEGLVTFKKTYLDRLAEFCTVMGTHGVKIATEELLPFLREEFHKRHPGVT